MRPLALALALLYGCALPASVRLYQPLVVPGVARQDAMYAAARWIAHEDGEVQIQEWPAQHRIVATRTDGDVRDMTVVQVAPNGDLEVEVRTQIAAGDNQWLTADVVCAGYGYARERAVAERINATLAFARR